MKKSYSIVSVKPQDNHFLILLDGRNLLTPNKNPFALKSQALADVVMQEWAAQGENVVPATMPLTQIVMTIQDIITPKRDFMRAELTRFLPTDLMLYLAPDRHLAVFQENLRQPYINAFNVRWQATLKAQTNISVPKIDPMVSIKIDKFLKDLPREQFGALQLATTETGSLILGLDLLAGGDVQAIVQAVYAEEIYYDNKNKAAGLSEDPEVTQKSNQLRLELQNIKHFLSLVG